MQSMRRRMCSRGHGGCPSTHSLHGGGLGAGWEALHRRQHCRPPPAARQGAQQWKRRPAWAMVPAPALCHTVHPSSQAVVCLGAAELCSRHQNRPQQWQGLPECQERAHALQESQGHPTAARHRQPLHSGCSALWGRRCAGCGTGVPTLPPDSRILHVRDCCCCYNVKAIEGAVVGPQRRPKAKGGGACNDSCWALCTKYEGRSGTCLWKRLGREQFSGRPFEVLGKVESGPGGPAT